MHQHSRWNTRVSDIIFIRTCSLLYFSTASNAKPWVHWMYEAIHYYHLDKLGYYQKRRTIGETCHMTKTQTISRWYLLHVPCRFYPLWQSLRKAAMVVKSFVVPSQLVCCVLMDRFKLFDSLIMLGLVRLDKMLGSGLNSPRSNGSFSAPVDDLQGCGLAFCLGGDSIGGGFFGANN